MTKDEVLVSASTFGDCGREPLDILKKSRLKIVRNPHGRRLASCEIINLGKDCVGMLAGLEALDKKTLERLPKLKVISRVGTGIDNIDLKAAKRLNMTVCNTPDAPTQAVAELAVGFILCLLRKIPLSDRTVRAGQWKRMTGGLIDGKTIGIIGLGRIGRRVTELLNGFDVSIIAYDIFPHKIWIKNKKIKMVELKELLKASDIALLHVSGKGCLIRNSELNMMKKGAYIINLCRGGVIDEEALYKALKSGRIAGAALDVFKHEPYSGRLTGLDNVILTPHIGSHTAETRLEMELTAVRNLLSGLKKHKRHK